MASNNIGPKRQVVGAQYGFKEWLAQRITAVIMIVYTVILLVSFLCGQNFSYEGWAALFAQQWFKLISAFTLFALAYHGWVGMRDVWMDYVKPVSIRLTLHIATILWLIACAVWSVQIIWSV